MNTTVSSISNVSRVVVVDHDDRFPNEIGLEITNNREPSHGYFVSLDKDGAAKIGYALLRQAGINPDSIISDFASGLVALIAFENLAATAESMRACDYYNRSLMNCVAALGRSIVIAISSNGSEIEPLFHAFEQQFIKEMRETISAGQNLK